MKITVILLIATFMQVSATGFAQRITLNKNDISLNQVFAEIRKQTGFDVLWESDQLKGSATIDAKFNNTPLEEVMNKCLDGKPLVFTIQDKTVVIKEKEPSFPDNLVARFTDIDAQLDFSWLNNADEADPLNTNSTDKVAFVVYNPSKQAFAKKVGAAVRSALSYDMVLPATWSGDNVHIWALFVSASGKVVSDSKYLDATVVQ